MATKTDQNPKTQPTKPAAFSVIDWPVAAAIGIGTELVRRSGSNPRLRPAAVEA